MQVDTNDGEREEFREGATTSASKACSQCKRYKRKCDKKLPKCGLCTRLRKECEYADERPVMPSPEELQDLKERVGQLESRLAQTSNNDASRTQHEEQIVPYRSSWLTDVRGHSPMWPSPGQFPAMFFLDSNGFEYDNLQVPRLHVAVPPGPCSMLWQAMDLTDTVNKYFSTVHTYMPVISKLRMQQHLEIPREDMSADALLLFGVMGLLANDVPPGDNTAARTQPYRDIKAFGHFVESHEGFSIRMIQALLLMALYEIGHGIYPAAFLTVGQASRVGIAIGIQNPQSPQILPRATNWIEVEERERIWWAIVILDRFVNIGHRRKPLACPEPRADTPLPVDERYWDSGERSAATSLGLSATIPKLSPFARVCQAGHLLGQIIRHIDTDDDSFPDYRYKEAHELHNAARAFSASLAKELDEADAGQENTLMTSMAICYSANLLLCSEYTSNEPHQTKAPASSAQFVWQQEGIKGLRLVAGDVSQLARLIQSSIARTGLESLNPLVLNCLYQAAATYTQYVREVPDSQFWAQLEELTELLRYLDERWKSAGEYVKILESKEIQQADAMVFD